LRESLFNGFNHAAHAIDTFEVIQSAIFQLVSQRFDKVRTAQWIDSIRYAGLFGNYLLRSQGDQGGTIRRQSERFVESICMQRLGAAQYSGERLDRNPHDVIQRLLHSQRYTGGLRVKTHLHDPLGLSAEAIAHCSSPNSACSSILGDLFKEVIVSVKEKRNPWYEALKIETGPSSPLDVFDSVSQSKREFLQRGRAGLANVITAHRNRVVPGNMLSTELEGIDDQLHRRANRINPLLLSNVLFENVVLQR